VFDYQPRLDGRLLELRPAAPDDWDGLFAVGSDPQVWAGHPSRDRHLERNFRAYFDGGLKSGGALIARRAGSGEVIGWSRYSSEFVDAGEIEIGWTFLGRAYWGGAYNAEMKSLMLQHAFRFVERVLFRIAETNVRSRRAAEKIGAKLLPGRPAPSGSDTTAPYVFYCIDREGFGAV
jgi:RimJ/RimL family protein N-acetyltransferase